MKEIAFRCKQVRFAVSSVLGTALIFALSPPGALAQEKVERVEITGSNIKRIAGETALPVQIITREDIERTGATTVEQYINSVGVALQGNNNSVAATASGATSGGVSGLSLRGLGSQRTLILINGRRVAPGGTITDSVTVDINTIPLAAVERIEILKDGASAIYGSDAIAGVVNFILRTNYRGAEATAYLGASEHGGGGVKRVNGLFGFGDFGQDKYNFTLFAGFQKEDALFGRQRDFAKSGINDLNDVTSGNTFPANITPVSGPFAGPSRNPSAPGCPLPYAILDPNRGSNACGFDPSPLVALLPEIKQTNLYATGRFAITPNMEGYAELGFNQKESRTVIQPVPISDQFALPPNHPLFNVAPYNGFSTIVLTPASPFYPTAYAQAQFGGTTPDLLVRWRDNINGNRDITDITKQTRAVFGVKGTAFAWDYDAGFLHMETKLAERVNAGFPSLSGILPILNSGQVNFFGPTPADVESQVLATGFFGDAYRVRGTTDSFTVRGQRELMQLPAGPLAIAVGAEERKEGFIINPSPAIQSGDISGYGGNFLPVDKSRNVTALWFEANVPIVRNLEATGAVRYDDYQNVGSKTTPKASVRWQPEKGLLLRASWGKGFRAPSLTELFSPQTTGVSANGLNDPARCGPGRPNGVGDCLTQFPLLLGGNPDLRPEESVNKTFGVVIEPNDRFSLALDAWSVDLKNTIIFGIDPAAILADPGRFGSLITRGPPDAAFPGVAGPITQIVATDLNLGKTNISGMDIDVKGRIPAKGWGTFTIGLTGTMIMKYRIQNPDGTVTSIKGQVSPIVNGAGGVIPEWRHYLYLDLKTANWNHTLSQNYQSGYRDIPGTLEDPADPAFKPHIVKYYTIYNFQTAYTGFKNWRLAAGIRNLLDTKPPYSNVGGQSYFQAGYDPGYVDPRGRFLYATVTYKFK